MLCLSWIGDKVDLMCRHAVVPFKFCDDVWLFVIEWDAFEQVCWNYGVVRSTIGEGGGHSWCTCCSQIGYGEVDGLMMRMVVLCNQCECDFKTV